jgi:hypothetical protein
MKKIVAGYTYAIFTIGVMNDTNLDKIDDKGYR